MHFYQNIHGRLVALLVLLKKEGGREVIQVLYGIVAIGGYFKFECAASL
jgi:hypothetical protein